MRNKSQNFLLLLLILFFLGTVVNLANGLQDRELTLPSQIKPWILDGKPEVYFGEDLFLYINGGAEIYYEYGFASVISGVYKNQQSKSINAEIYQMKDSDAAFGIYSFKTSPKGKRITIGGYQGVLEDYYLNLWMGNYKITLVGFDQAEDTIQGLLDIGGAIVKNLPDGKFLPPKIVADLISKLPEPQHVKYLRGELGLFNIHRFANTNLFRFKEGVVGFYDKHKLFVFYYADEREQKEVFFNLSNYFKGIPNHEFRLKGKGYVVIDRSKNAFFVYPKKKYIYIYLAESIDVLINILKHRGETTI